MISFESIHAFVNGMSLWQIGLAAGIGFGFIYFGLAGLSLYATRRLLPRLGIGALIDPRPLQDKQIRNEIFRSFISIAIFAGYGALTVWCDRMEFITIIWQPTVSRILLDLLILTIWNEIHFYACHRLLHTRWLYRKVHIVHHRSVIPTPFSTYSFHPVEATMLSSVMILLMLIWPLDIVTIIFFPLVSLTANNIGHMNYAVFPSLDHSRFFAACQRHTAHHTRITGNYGFYVPWLDRWLGTKQTDRKNTHE